MSEEQTSRWILVATVVAILAGGVFALLDLDAGAQVSFLLAAGIPVVPLVSDIVASVRRGRPGVDVIALLAVGGALLLGEFLTAAIIGLMLATGRYLEGYAARRAESELTTLLERAPRTAHRIGQDRVEEVEIDEIQRGDRVLVRAGEVIPVDGVIRTERASIDESALTGEPLPVERARGDVANSGAVNAGDAFEIHVTAGADASTYAGIIRLVEEARASRAPSVRLADRWAGWFIPVALGMAGLAWAVSGDPVRGLAVLVVATPCPLLLAVPIAIVSGISRAARRGVVFRGGEPLEILARTRFLLIDKTGTVTVGRPALRSVTVFDGRVEDDEALRLAASVDQTSTHVLARAIVEAAHDRGLDLEIPSEIAEATGSGVSGTVDGTEVAVGRLDWLLGEAPEPPDVAAFRRRLSPTAPTAVYVAVDGAVTAAITFEDRIRPDAAATIRALRRSGIERVVMATGDHPVVARSVATAVGVDDVLAECTPRDKVEALEELRSEGITTMVGDGINDAPALASADVGVAMGARGATASSEAARVVLLVDELDRLVDAIGIAQRSRSIAGQSVAIGMGLSLVAMTVASFGLLAPLVGALVQEGIDVVAIVNSLRALGGRPPTRTGPSISPELSRRLHDDHDELVPRLGSILDAADRLDTLSAEEAAEELEAVRVFLVEEVLPHETHDEEEVYPTVSDVLPGEDPMATMSRTHREIFHLIEVYRRQLDELPPDGPEPSDLRDLRRTLYSLHAILRLHFDQEEELYQSLRAE